MSLVALGGQGMREVSVRICGRLLLLIDHRVLLVRETDPAVSGVQWWALPGGGVEPGEDPRAAAVREVAEETGYRTRWSRSVCACGTGRLDTSTSAGPITRAKACSCVG